MTIFRRSCGKMSHKLARNILQSHSHAPLFGEQQMKTASVKDACTMRWHPVMVKWCLYLQHKSSSAYELLRESGVIKLLSQRTVKDYTRYIQAVPGFSPKVDQQLMEAAEIATCPEFKKCVFLLLDEMHVKEDLVYDKHTGMFVGEKYIVYVTVTITSIYLQVL